MQHIYVTKEYNRNQVWEYALTWALDRNPLFFDFTEAGGDCTNFASQCILAGSCMMNYTPVYGWYYVDVNNRTASWTGVEFLYNFLTQNTGVGPYAHVIQNGRLEIGDIIQLSNRNGVYYHTLVVTGVRPRTYLVAAHTNDVRERPLSTYSYYRARFIHIDGVRLDIETEDSCFPGLISGTELT